VLSSSFIAVVSMRGLISTGTGFRSYAGDRRHPSWPRRENRDYEDGRRMEIRTSPRPSGSRLCRDGTDMFEAANGDQEWTDNNAAYCGSCGHGGTVSYAAVLTR
jgi:hypothetical protein